MFGLDDWIAHVLGRQRRSSLVIARRDPARPAPRDRPRPPRRRDDADRLGPRARRRGAAARLGLCLGPRPRDDALRVRRCRSSSSRRTCPSRCSRAPRPTVGFLIVGARASGCSSAGAAALFHVHVHAHGTGSHAHVHTHATGRTRTLAAARARRSRPTGSGSCTGWAAARASASSSSPRSTTAASRSVALALFAALHRGLDGAALDRLRADARRARRHGRSLRAGSRPRSAFASLALRPLVRARRLNRSRPYVF